MSRAWRVTLLLLAASWWQPLPAAEPTVAETDRHELGRRLYNYRCYVCHGYSGDAATLASTYLTPPPRDFTRETLAREQMLDSVTHGKPGTAMHGFSRVLERREIEAVVDFVRREFMLAKRANTRYHTAANGWPRHRRYREAFPFARGEIPLDRPWRELTPAQTRGKRLFLSACITCHDRARVTDEGDIWRKQSISYPRNQYSHRQPDAISAASIYARHDRAPDVDELSFEARRGAELWQSNCAFCHAADGTGENWIGSFLERPPRNLTDGGFMRHMTRERLRQRIRDGLPGTSMPAWKSVLEASEIDAIISYIDETMHPLGGG